MRRHGLRAIGPLLAAAAVALAAGPALAFADALVTSGSATTPFPQNKQNEPAIARAPFDGSVLIAGVNDELDLQPCFSSTPSGPGSCPFTAGVGISGVYFSFNDGASWVQPTYQGWSARTGKAKVGPIGTLPNYFEAGLVNNGDPIVTVGPRPDSAGKFSWSNGRRYYYSNLVANFPGSATLPTNFFAVGVSFIDDPSPARIAVQSNWSSPKIASGRLNPVLFNDKSSMWVDNASSSPFFGRVYASWTAFRAAVSRAPHEPEPIMIAHSDDGGNTWSDPVQVTQATNTAHTLGRQGSAIRTDSHGTVFLVFEGSVPVPGTGSFQAVQMLARSFDGGRTFEKQRSVATVTDVGRLDPFLGRFTFDGTAGARTDSFPSLDIANGAPTGAAATDRVLLGWSDGTFGNESALVAASNDGGDTWSTPVAANDPNDRPDFTAVAISPDGRSAYVVYDAFQKPVSAYADNLFVPRFMQGVVRGGNAATLSGFTTLHRGAMGDARSSAQNNQVAEFLGDYNYVTASNSKVYATWNDTRAGDVCDAVQKFRAAIRGLPASMTSGVDWGEDNAASADAQVAAAPRPLPSRDCPSGSRFGNSDIFSVTATR